MKILVKYGSFVRHSVSCSSNSELNFVKLQLKLREIPYEIIDFSKITEKERLLYQKAEYSFIRFKKEILKKI